MDFRTFNRLRWLLAIVPATMCVLTLAVPALRVSHTAPLFVVGTLVLTLLIAPVGPMLTNRALRLNDRA